MERHWPCALLITLGFLAVATSASAECAWVLWNSGTMGPWDVRDAFDSLVGCQQALEMAISKAALEKPEASITVTIGSASNKEIAYTTKEGTKVLLSLRCLPDTVDPRGPKGK